MRRKLKERALAMALAAVMTVSNIPMNSFAAEYEPVAEEQTEMNAEQYAEEPAAQDEYAQDDYQEPAQDEYYQEPAQDDSAQEPAQEPAQQEEPAQEPAAADEGAYLPDLDGSAGGNDETADAGAEAAAQTGEVFVDEISEEDGIQEEAVEGSNGETVDSEYDIPFEDLIFDEDIVDDETMELLMDGDRNIVYSKELEDFITLTTLSIHHADGSDTEYYEIEPGDPIPSYHANNGDIVTLSFNFAEVPNELQFDMNVPPIKTLTYDLPDEGLLYDLINNEGQVIDDFEVVIDGHDPDSNPFQIKGTVSVVGTELQLVWDSTTDPDMFALGQEATDLRFSVHLRGEITADEDVIDHGGVGKFYIDNTGKLDVAKTFKFLPEGTTAPELTQAQRQATTFSVTLNVARTDPDASAGETVDNWGYVRNADGHIQYHEQTFTFTYDDIYNSTVTNQAGNKVYEITGVLGNNTYTVQETGVSTIPGFSRVENHTLPWSEPVDIAKAGKGAVSYQNTYTKDVGTMNVSKTVNGTSSLSNEEKSKIKFTLYEANGTTRAKKADGTQVGIFSYFDIERAGGTYPITDLPVGNYVLKETDYNTLSGYNYTSTTYSITVGSQAATSGTGTSTTANETAIQKDTTTAVAFTNNYEHPSANLKFTKTFVTATGQTLTEAQKAQTTFIVKDSDGNTVWFASNGAYIGTTASADTPPAGSTGAICQVSYADMTSGAFTITNIPTGTYTVVENNVTEASGYSCTTTYKVNGGSSQNGNQASVPVLTEGNTESVAFTNTFKNDMTLKLTKTFYRDGTAWNPSNDIKNNTIFTIKNAAGQIVKLGARASHSAGKATYPFSSFGTSGNTITFYNMGDSASAKTLTITGMPEGTYTVTETGRDLAGYEHTITYQVSSVTLGGTTTSGELKVRDDYNRIRGKLKITKGFEFPTSDHLTQDQMNAVAFTVTSAGGSTGTITYGALVDAVANHGGSLSVTLVNGNSTYTYPGTVTQNTDGTYSIVIDNLPADTTYTVAETGDKDVLGYIRTTTVSLDGVVQDNTQHTDSASANPVPASEGNPHEIAFTNEYVPRGFLKITKNFTGILSDQYCINVILPKLRFRVTDSEGNPVNHFHTNEAGETVFDNIYSYTDLTSGSGLEVEAGKQYIVTEIATYANVENYDRTTTIYSSGAETPEVEHPGTRITYTNDEQDAASRPDIVNKNDTTVYHFANNYSTIGPGEGFIFHKIYGGLDEGDKTYPYAAGTEHHLLHNRIMIRIRGYEEATHETLIYDATIPLTQAYQQKIVVGPGYYVIEELGMTEDGAYSAAALDLFYFWNVTAFVGTNPTPHPIEFHVTTTHETVTLSFSNNYTPFGSLVVKKSFAGLTDAQIDTLKDKITFTLKRYDTISGGYITETGFPQFGDAYKITNPIKLSDMTKGADGTYSYPFTYLHVGKYIVEETIESEIGNYTRTSYVTVGGTRSDGTSAQTVTTEDVDEITVVRGGIEAHEVPNYPPASTPAAQTVAFDNEYNPDLGNIVVKKVFDGDYANMTAAQKAALAQAITFTITDSSNHTVHWKEVGGSYVYDPEGAISEIKYADFANDPNGYKITKVPVGTYKVTETNADVDGFHRTTTVQVNSGQATPAESANGNVTKNGTVTFTFTNEYTEHGMLKITKEFDPVRVADTTNGKAVTFSVYESNGTTLAKDLAGNNITFTYAQMTSGSKTVELSPGDYVIKEDGQNFTTDNFTFTGATVNGTTYNARNGYPVTVGRYTGQESQIKVAGFKNSYGETGSLTIKKTVGGLDNMTTDQMKAIVFIVKKDGEILPDNEGNFVTDKTGTTIGTFTFLKMTNGAYTLNNLAAGTYTVDETILTYTTDMTDTDNLFYGYSCSQNVEIESGAGTHTGTTATVQVDSNGVITAYSNIFSKRNAVSVVKTGEGEPAGYATINGVKYPYWEFMLNAQYLTTDLDITDYFDVNPNKLALNPPVLETTDRTEYFRVATAADGADLAPQIQLAVPADNVGTPSVTVVPADGQATFQITGIQPASTNTNGYVNATITYYLIAKDEATVGILNSDLEHDDSDSETGVAWNFNNVVSYKEFPADTQEKLGAACPYNYEYTVLDKDITNFKDTGLNVKILIDEFNHVTIIAQFEVVINRDGVKVGDKNWLKAYDTLSNNLSMRWDTIEAFRILDYDDATHTWITDDIDTVSWEECDCTEGPKHTIHFTLPNATPVLLRYEVMLDTESAVDNLVDIKNKFSMEGFSDEIIDIASIEGYGEGDSQLYAMKYLKFEEGNASHKLAGAIFELWDDKDSNNPVKTRTLVSDDDGKVTIRHPYEDSIDGLSPDNPYHIKEIQPPPGYVLPEGEDGEYYFIVSKHNTGSIEINGVTYQISDDHFIDYGGKAYKVYKVGVATENIYNTPFDTTIKLAATKNLLRKNLTEGAFSFTLTALDGAPSPSDEYDWVTVSNDVDGNAEFGTITYKFSDLDVTTNADGEVTAASKTFNYTVTEVIPSGATDNGDGTFTKAGITYDGTAHTVEVTVSLNSTKDGLDAVVKIDGEVATADENLVYWAEVENSYDAEGDAYLSAGKQADPALGTRKFTFELYAVVDDTTTPVTLGDDPLQTSAEVTQGNPVSFTKLHYTLADLDLDDNGTYQKVFKYAIKETIPTGATDNGDGTYTKDGITYDGHIEYVNIQVSDNGDGTLSVKYNGKNAFTTPYFENEYDAEGEAQLSAMKAGNPDLGNTTFQFQLLDANNRVIETSPGVTQGSSVDFTAITYKLSDLGGQTSRTYTYHIKEVIPSDAQTIDGHKVKDGITYDEHVEDVEVVVTDKGDGTLGVTYNGKTQFTTPEFENTYAAEGGAQFKAKKAAEPNLRDATFRFQLLDADGGVLQTSEPVKQNQTATFNAIQYSLSDLGGAASKDFTYQIKEVIPDDVPTVNGKRVKDGITYDETVVTVVVTVTNDGSGELSVKYDGSDTFTTPQFANTYDAEGHAVLSAKKAGNANLGDKTFQFLLLDNTDTVIETSDPVAQGETATFTQIDYTLADLGGQSSRSYTYKIKELIPEGATQNGAGQWVKDGVIYDSHTETVTVKVSDGGNGELVVEYDGKDTFTTPEFDNQYDAKGSAVLKAKKAQNTNLGNHPFQFQLLDNDGNVIQTSEPVKQNETFTFTTIQYTLAQLGDDTSKDFIYHIREVIPEGATQNEAGKWVKDGITYDDHTEDVTVTVTNTGNGDLEVTYNGQTTFTTPEFRNEYDAKGSAVMSAKKAQNTNLGDNTFQFQLLDENDEVIETSAAVKQNQSVSFTAIEYTLEDLKTDEGTYVSSRTFTYKIKEVIPDDAVENSAGQKVKDGVIYDEHIQTVHVIVTNDGNGGLTVSYDGQNNFTTPEFTNTYEAKGSAVLKAKKAANTNLGNHTFQFQLLDADDNVLQTSAAVMQNETVTFEAIPYTLADLKGAPSKDFTYKIKEVIPSDAQTINGKKVKDGVTYDETVYSVTVTVTDAGDGDLEVTYNGQTTFTTPEFRNEYDAKGSAVMSAMKAQNTNLGNNTFQFELLDADDNVLQTSTAVSQNQSVSFDAIEYTLEDLKNDDDTYATSKEFTYKIREVIPADAETTPDGKKVKDGVTYDQHVETVVVKVTNDGNGTLVVTYNGQNSFITPEFDNLYGAEGEAVLSAKKAQNANLGNKKFQFVLMDNLETTLQTSTEVEANQTVNFEKITYTLSDLGGKTSKDFIYKIKELIPADAVRNNAGQLVKDGVIYDESVKTVTVTVTNNGDGTLSVTYDNSPNFTTPEFENGYDASGSAVMSAKKAGNANLGEKRFQFQLLDANDNVMQTTTAVKQGQSATFEAIPYTLSDLGNQTSKQYMYKIKEVIPNDAQTINGKKVKDGVTYDETVHTVVVTVTNDGNGNLDVTYGDGQTQSPQFTTPEFTNEYEAAGTATLSAKKAGNVNLVGKKFQFELLDGDNNDDHIETSEEVEQNQTATFTTIPYTLEDLKNEDGVTYAASKDFTYKIREVIPTDAETIDGKKVKDGVTYDEHVETIIVTVTNNGDGQLLVTYNNETTFTTPVFNNTYDAQGHAILSAKKAGNALLGDDKTFEFRLLDGADNVIETSAPVKQGETAEFTQIDYTMADLAGAKSKTYTYKIKEVIPTDAEKNSDDQWVKDGVIYDDRVVTVTVVVTNNDNGGLDVTYDGNENFTTPEFNNTYNATGKAKLSAKKAANELLGSNKFQFQLLDSEGNVLQTSEAVAQNEVATFQDILYTIESMKNAEDGYDTTKEFTYKIKEVIPDDAETIDGKKVKDGVTYDETVVEVKVTVRNDGNGHLLVTYNDLEEGAEFDPAEFAQFTNTYQAVGSIVLDGVKTWDKTLKGEDFTFTLTEVDEDGKTIKDDFEPVPNNADGTFEFEELTYTLNETQDDTGVHYYQIAEEADPQNKDTVFDDTVFTVKVTVTDNKDGTLKVEKEVLEAPEVKFYNAVPSIVKAVNKDSHVDLKGFNEIYTYDIVALIPKDAEQIVIHDDLVPGVMFKSTYDEVIVKDLGDLGPDAEQQYTAGNGGVFSDTLGKAINMNTPVNKITISGKSLTVTIGDTNGLKGHHVRVTFEAMIDPAAVSDMATYEDQKFGPEDNGLLLEAIFPHEGIENGAYYTITPTNAHKYETYHTNKVTVTPPPTTLDISKIWLKDVNGDGEIGEDEYLDWPVEKDEDGNEYKVPITFTLYMKKDDQDVPVYLHELDEEGNLKPGDPVLQQVTLPCEDLVTGEEKTSYTFENLPVYLKNPDTTGVTNPAKCEYFVKEEDAEGITGVYDVTGDQIEDNLSEDPEAYKYEVKNTNDEIPEIAKTVNKDVHAQLEAYDEIFVYDIIAYVTKDAVTTTITDELVKGIMMVSAANEVEVTDLGETVDYTAGSSGSFAADGTKIDDAIVEITGSPAKAETTEATNASGDAGTQSGSTADSGTGTTSGTDATGDTGTTGDATGDSGTTGDATGDAEPQTTAAAETLKVTIENSKPYRGHYVKVTFRAKLNNDIVKDLGSYEANKTAISDNGLVISDILTHEGVMNQAYYTITANNGFRYDNETYPDETTSNIVTVTPKETTIDVEKKWQDDLFQPTTWPKGAVVVVTLLDNGEKTDRTVTLDAEHQSGTFKDIPIWKTKDEDGKDITPLHVYTVEETSVAGIPNWYHFESITGDAAEGYTILNTMELSGNVVAPTGKKYYENGTLTEGLFTFNVLDKEGNVVSTGTSQADGSILFKQIVYHQHDLGDDTQKYFDYTIQEVIPNGANASNNYTLYGITYDPTKIKFRVRLTRLDNGTLDAEIEYTGGEVTFRNANVRKTRFTPVGLKTYKNGTLTEGGFSFTIKDAAGNKVSTGKSKADGTIVFSSIEYKEADLEGAKEKTFTYSVTEDMPSGAKKSNKYTVNGITYDPSVKKLTVKVTVNDDGTMTALQTSSASSVSFLNTKEGGKKNGGNSGSGSGGGSGIGGNGGTSVKTGDETPIMLYGVMMVVALGGVAGAGVMIKRRKRRNAA